MAEQPSIADHAIIGDLQTAALVASNGDVDWFCTPRFDSPSVFASLLDADRGGRFRIAPEGDGHLTKQGYLGDTAVLATRFMAEESTGSVIDFMPVSDPEVARDQHTIVRLVRGVRGRMRFRMSCAPRFDYGRASHAVEVTPAGAVFESGGTRLVLHAGVPLEQVGDDVVASFELEEGEDVGFVLETAGDGPRPVEEGEVLAALDAHGRLLALVAGGLDLPGAVARDGQPVRHHPQAADLRPDRRTDRGGHRRPPRAVGRGAQLGLPLHLDPRLVVLGTGPARSRVHRGGRAARPLGRGPGARNPQPPTEPSR